MSCSTGEEWCQCSTNDETFYLLREHPDGCPEQLGPNLEPLRLHKLIQDIKRAISKELMDSACLPEWQNLVKGLQDEGVLNCLLLYACFLLSDQI
jgi:hypothetical protein